MRKIESAVLSRFEPADKNVMWVMPSGSDLISIKLFNNGKWMGTDSTVDLSSYLTKEDAQKTYQPVGDYALRGDIPSLEGYATEEWVTSRGFLTSVPDNYVTDSDLVEALASYATSQALTEGLAGKEGTFSIGTGLEMTAERVLNVTLDTTVYATKTELTEHTGNTSNPHSVTKAQVGLGNVDNTSDADKPVSTAQQAAINAVDNKTAVYTIVPTLSADYTIPANATTREYIYEISIGATTYNVTAAEGIKWIDNTLPLVEANSRLIVSVINNIAVWGAVHE